MTFSSVSGKNLPASSGMSANINKIHKFEAMGVSVICHPKNPKAPTSHFNVRTFMIFDKKDISFLVRFESDSSALESTKHVTSQPN